MIGGREGYEVKALMVIAQVLVVVGALNWGLVGLYDFNLVTTILGSGIAERIVYFLVGVAGLVGIYSIAKLGSSPPSGQQP